MFFELNITAKKQISLFIILVIFMSCIVAITYDLDKDINSFDINEMLSNTDVAEVSYEVLAFQDIISQNRFKDRSSRTYNNDKIAMLLYFCATNNIDRSINNTILKNLSDIYLTHDTILTYIHKKDGKKQLI